MKDIFCKNAELTELFNTLVPAVKPIAMIYVEDGVLNHVELDTNKKTGLPQLTFVFQKQSSPALSYLPENIDGVPVDHKFDNGYIAHFYR